MKQNQSELSEKAWISRFWAQYRKLPEPCRDGFIYLAQNLVKEAGSGKQSVFAIPSVILTKKSKRYKTFNE